MSHQVVIDDTDPSITYSGGWFLDTSPGHGNFGTPYNHTSHASIVSGSSLTYSFNGTAVVVQGAIDVSTDASGTLNPSWTCLVDGAPITNPNPTFRFPENNWMLCCEFDLTPGAHKLEVQINTTGQPFYLDSILVTPLPDAKPGPGVVKYWNNDSSVVFGPGWVFTNMSTSAKITQTVKAQVEFTFEGTSASLVGVIPSDVSHNASTAAYSIDGGSSTVFTLPGLNSDTDAYNMVFFTTPNLTLGTHTMTIVNRGNSSKTPLTVDYFYVSNFTAPGSAAVTVAPTTSNLNAPTASIVSSTVSSSSGFAVPSSYAKSTRKLALGLGLGVGVGIIVLPLIALVLFCSLRRRRQAALRPVHSYKQVRRPRSSAHITPYVTPPSSSAIPVDPSPMAGPSAAGPPPKNRVQNSMPPQYRKT
ncbi:hypothetical protein B0H10DRAFT_509592 [Mycena sp. CBHHK59/15]|nr:hypothetical protein B0H10DRAFT_509592 [Mycena sp. CBHHK59/15]